MKIILYLWQLPQHFLALIIWAILRIAVRTRRVENRSCLNLSTILIWVNISSWGLSLGKYIFIDNRFSETTVKHEMGHSIQSRRFGPLYLLIVGFPSITRNIWQRLFHKNWTRQDRVKWYYSSWPENHADKLGGVKRRF